VRQNPFSRRSTPSSGALIQWRQPVAELTKGFRLVVLRVDRRTECAEDPVDLRAGKLDDLVVV
jgi:sugar lactone lactonase YvrE